MANVGLDYCAASWVMVYCILHLLVIWQDIYEWLSKLAYDNFRVNINTCDVVDD
jgi:hypothetical protein